LFENVVKFSSKNELYEFSEFSDKNEELKEMDSENLPLIGKKLERYPYDVIRTPAILEMINKNLNE